MKSIDYYIVLKFINSLITYILFNTFQGRSQVFIGGEPAEAI